MSWQARTKDDLIIEVWEKLDCESVGAAEIEAIETAVAAEFGSEALDSPMLIARLLADEGAELRHEEIMNLYVKRAEKETYGVVLDEILNFDDLACALTTIYDLEDLRRRYSRAGDREGLRRIREAVLEFKNERKRSLESGRIQGPGRQISIEIIQWLSLWLQTPELFSGWVKMRIETRDFIEKFGRIGD